MRFSILILALTLVPALAIAERYSVVLPDIPKPVTIDFPSGYSLASTSEAQQRRERLLDFYRLNKGLKGQYGDILLSNWTNQTRLPIILVGVLGSTSKFQGRISENNWAEIRKTFLNASQSQIAEVRSRYRPNIETNSPAQLKHKDELFWLEDQKDTNSAVVIAHLRYELEGEIETVFSARKLIYYKGYLVVVNVILDATKPDSLNLMKKSLDDIRLISI